MSISPQKIIEEVDQFLSQDDNRNKLYAFLEKFSQCEVYCRPIMKQYFHDLGEDIKDEDIGLDSRDIKNAFGENGIYFEDKRLLTRIFGAESAPSISSCRWLRNKITHELRRRAVREACERIDELITDMDLFISQINNQQI